MVRLKIILASTRPGRKGPFVAKWIHQLAKKNKHFKIELLDLKEIALPFHDEPIEPVHQDYRHAHTKRWSQAIDDGDAFIFVHPEYNHGYSAPLKNALDYLFKEWNYKPVAFVSYGGIAGGTRAAQMLVQVVTALKMMPLTESVHIPFFTKYIKDDVFTADKFLNGSAQKMLKELVKWAESLKKTRNKK